MTESEISLDRYFRSVWRAKWIILLLVACAAAISGFITFRKPALHTASALLQVGRVWSQPLEDPYVTSEIANSPGFINELAASLRTSAAYLRRSVRAETVTAGPPRNVYPILVRIMATTEIPAESVRLARAFAEAVVEQHAERFDQALASHLDHQRRLEEQYAAVAKTGFVAPLDGLLKLDQELFGIRARNSSPTETAKTRLVGEVVPGPVIRPDVVRNAGAAAIVAALVGVLGALIAGHFSTPVAQAARGQSDAEGA